MDLSLAQIATLAALAAGSFIATNIDNLVLMVVLKGSHPQRRLAVAAGYLLSVTFVLLACIAGSLLGAVLNAGLVGYLGFVPLGFGVALLLRRQRATAGPDPAPEQQATLGWWAVCLSSAGIMAGNSGDSLAILLPLSAETLGKGLPILLLMYLVWAVCWATMALGISRQRALADHIEKHGARLVPWLMIAIGFYILANTATDTLL